MVMKKMSESVTELKICVAYSFDRTFLLKRFLLNRMVLLLIWDVESRLCSKPATHHETWLQGVGNVSNICCVQMICKYFCDENCTVKKHSNVSIES
jgi:hypothetical protein